MEKSYIGCASFLFRAGFAEQCLENLSLYPIVGAGDDSPRE